ncbi:hypothetical protein RN001_005429 [Aquatica leii]|uniref:Myb/SANT-like DNA-binding domain-containing protein n=1 Tax=Aquatica leii TaxID=1421715 RepID=A0AAN7Q6Z6_9COLE|nr:hypothetical protein RN001_005429 [Aquatica leii]
MSDIFKTLVAPLEQAGFHRDIAQLTVKWKNLKAEYHKCKRHNGVSGNDPRDYESYTPLNEILGHRPSVQSVVIQNEDPSISIEMFEDAPDVDGAIPGCSKTPGIEMVVSRESSPSISQSSTKSHTKKLKSSEILLKIHEDIKSTLSDAKKQESEADQQFLETLIKQQEQIMVACTSMLLKGFQDIFGRSDD